MRKLFALAVVAAIAASLGGCVVAPYGDRGHDHGGRYDNDRGGRYDNNQGRWDNDRGQPNRRPNGQWGSQY